MDVLISSSKSKLLEGTDPLQQDFFGFKSPRTIPYLQSQLVFASASHTPVATFKLSCIIPKNYDFYISNMCFSFTVPSIIGKGSVGYCDYFGYSAIDSVELRVGHADFVFKGDYIFQRAMQLPNFDSIAHAAGHRASCRRIDHSGHMSQLIKPEESINVLIDLPMNENTPKNMLKLAPNDEITIKIHLKHLTKLINYNSGFNLNFSRYNDYNLKVRYYTKPKNNKISYEPVISLPEEYSSLENTIKLPSCRNILFRKDYGLSNREYVTSFGDWKTEADILDSFQYVILENLIHLYPAAEAEALIAKDFPASANLVEVENGHVKFDSYGERSYTRDIVVSIKNVPKEYRIFYHTNSLIINKYYDLTDRSIKTINQTCNQFNLSEKILEANGYYDSASKKIIYQHIKHRLTTQQASIPLDIYRTLGECNLKLDFSGMIINNYFVNGCNLYEPQTLYNYRLYMSSTDQVVKRDDFCIIEEQGEVALFEPGLFKGFFNMINLTYNINETRYIQHNLDSSIKFFLELNDPVFHLKKNEYNCTLDVKTFTEANHTEKGFECLFPGARLVVYIFDNYIINHEFIGDAQVSIKRLY